MCGIAGIWVNGRGDPASVEGIARSMGDALSHRGPDDAGVWSDGDVAFAHRRLAVIDLSPLGHQPMSGVSGRYTICFNGEIYNFASLRRDLERAGRRFSSSSDTEVILAAVEAWGIARALTRLRGMFAIAVWEASTRTLYLARDRMGEKPLYYGSLPNGDFVFGSELKALFAYERVPRQVDARSFCQYLTLGYVPAPRTLVREIRKLEPGHVLRVARPDAPPECSPYWNRGSQSEVVVGANEADHLEELDSLLHSAVQEQMVADVPVGAFLSGGIDSSLVTAVMQRLSATPVRTFTIGFADSRFDESSHASLVAGYLGTDHTTRIIEESEALHAVQSLAEIYDEPIADSSQIPTVLLSGLARRHVTVALTGDGGDELFGGYDRYRMVPSAWRRLHLIPRPFRALGAGILRTGVQTARGARVARALSARSYSDLALLAISLPGPARGLWSERGRVEAAAALGELSPPENPAAQARFDERHYLPDDLLVKLDRAAMLVALEGRVPLLDHRIVEFAARVPWAQKSSRTRGKLLLRRLLTRYVPRELIDRPKQGFEVPIGAWINGALREFVDDSLMADAVQHNSMLDKDIIGAVLAHHRNGSPAYRHLIWALACFAQWQRRWNVAF